MGTGLPPPSPQGRSSRIPADRSPTDFCPLPRFSSRFIPAVAAASGTHIYAATRKPILASPGGPRTRRGGVTLPGGARGPVAVLGSGGGGVSNAAREGDGGARATGWVGACQGGPESRMGAEGGGISASPPASKQGFQVSTGRRGQRNRSRSPSGPRLPSGGRAPGGSRFCVGCCLPCPFSLLLPHGRPQFARFISLPLTPARSHGGRASSGLPPQPGGPRGSAPALGPRFAAGSEPSRRRHSRWAAGAKPAGRGRSVFRAPLSFHGPVGRVVLPLAPLLREKPQLGDQKTTNPCMLRNEGGRGAVQSVPVLSVGDGNQQRERCGWLPLSCAGALSA